MTDGLECGLDHTFSLNGNKVCFVFSYLLAKGNSVAVSASFVTALR